MTPALAGVLQATAKLCLRHGIALKISHVAGERNPWADALSTVQGPCVVAAIGWSQLLSCSSEVAQAPEVQEASVRGCL